MRCRAGDTEALVPGAGDVTTPHAGERRACGLPTRAWDGQRFRRRHRLDFLVRKLAK